MNLINYDGKKVRIISIDNKVYEGLVGDYCYPEDDENDLEMIIVDVTKGTNVGKPVGFYGTDIKSIEILE